MPRSPRFLGSPSSSVTSESRAQRQYERSNEVRKHAYLSNWTDHLKLAQAPMPKRDRLPRTSHTDLNIRSADAEARPTASSPRLQPAKSNKRSKASSDVQSRNKDNYLTIQPRASKVTPVDDSSSSSPASSHFSRMIKGHQSVSPTMGPPSPLSLAAKVERWHPFQSQPPATAARIPEIDMNAAQRQVSMIWAELENDYRLFCGQLWQALGQTFVASIERHCPGQLGVPLIDRAVDGPLLTPTLRMETHHDDGYRSRGDLIDFDLVSLGADVSGPQRSEPILRDLHELEDIDFLADWKETDGGTNTIIEDIDFLADFKKA